MCFLDFGFGIQNLVFGKSLNIMLIFVTGIPLKRYVVHGSIKTQLPTHLNMCGEHGALNWLVGSMAERNEPQTETTV